VRPALIIAALVLALSACSGRTVPEPAGSAAEVGVTEQGADRGKPGDQGGPGAGSFGDRCGANMACVSGLLCVSMGGKYGFCSSTCPKPGQTCKKGPVGTVPVCLLKAQNSNYYCAFLCKTATASWPCPKDLTCSTKPNPAGSKQYICIP